MYLRLFAIAIGMSATLTAQFVNSPVRTSQAQTAYVDSFSKAPSDQVVQYKMSNPVINPPAGTSRLTAWPSTSGATGSGWASTPANVNLSGLPARAREALETASLPQNDVSASTDAAGTTRFSTTVNGRSIPRTEPRRSETLMTPLNKALWRSLIIAAEMDPVHPHGGGK